jgi:hypothetical protein
VKVSASVAVILCSCQGSDDVAPYAGGQSCFAALELYCRTGRDMAPRVRFDEGDLDLGLCLPFLDGSVKHPTVTRDVETTFHYDDGGQLVDLASECGQGETIHTRAEIGGDGRIERWLIDLDLIDEDVEYKDYVSAVREMRYSEEGVLLGDYNETIFLGGEEPETYAWTRTMDLGPPYARTGSTVGELGSIWYGERSRGFVPTDDGVLETLFELSVRRPSGEVIGQRQVDYAYDEQGQLLSISDVTPYELVDDSIISAEYEWEDGRLVSAAVADTGRTCSDLTSPQRHTANYAYEGKTVTVRIDSCSASVDGVTQTWEFDADGRLVRFQHETGSDDSFTR